MIRAPRYIELTLALLAAVCFATPAAADWTVFVSGNIGISSTSTDVAGTSDSVMTPDPGNPGTELPLVLAASGGDSSPILGGAIGLVSPLDQVAPWNLPFGWRPPSWPFRFEFEISGLRQYEVRTVGFRNPVTGEVLACCAEMFTSTDSLLLSFNWWQDMPMRTLERPVNWMFRRRTPRFVKKFLDTSALYVGGGVGATAFAFSSTDNNTRSAGDSANFAWQVGTGWSYELTPAVSVELGYRFIDAGTGESRFLEGTNVVPTDVGPYAISQTAHEFRTALRINLYSFNAPWR
jgi:opacity protein-like surface antigen